MVPPVLVIRAVSSRNLRVVGWVMVWVPVVLLIDQFANVNVQRLLGAGTWLMLFLLLRQETPLVRVQTAVVVAFATLVEYTFSSVLEVYVYRLDNLPAYVMPGHGLVYLAALSLGRSKWMNERAASAIGITVFIGALYAGWGLSPLADRADVLGAFWFLCLLGFLRWGRSPLLYVGAFVVVTYLELLGTWSAAWTWSAVDPTGLVAIGNPPSGAAGGYGWFDLAAAAAVPWLLRRLTNFAGKDQPVAALGCKSDSTAA